MTKVGIRTRPATDKALLVACLFRFGDHVKVHMVYNLMRCPAVILEDVEVLGALQY